jgi:hypothetical protein
MVRFETLAAMILSLVSLSFLPKTDFLRIGRFINFLVSTAACTVYCHVGHCAGITKWYDMLGFDDGIESRRAINHLCISSHPISHYFLHPFHHVGTVWVIESCSSLLGMVL